MKERQIIQSVVRALDVLRSFTNDTPEKSFMEIVRELGLSKAAANRILATLEMKGFVTRDAVTGKYRLGTKIFELGMLVHNTMDLSRIAHPYLETLMQRFKETVHLAIWDQGDVLYVDKVDSPLSISMNSHIGRRLPCAYCSAIGKVLAAFQPPEIVEETVGKKGLTKYTANTIDNFEELQQELARIRKNGYAIDNEEIEIGLCCVAAPIFDYRGHIVAGVSVAGPTMRVNGQTIPEIITILKDIAASISREVGYREYKENLSS